MEHPHPSTLAWATLAAGVTAYEIACPKGETLSEGVDRLLDHKAGRVLGYAAIFLTSAHLANLLPERFDPFHRALLFKDSE